MLNIRLLGDFEIDHDGRPLTGFGSPRLQSLLANLLLHRSAPQPRQRIAFLFWPDTSESQAHTNLRNLLHLLRRALPEPSRFLDVTRLTVQWRPDAPFTLDAAELDGALSNALIAESPHALADAMERASSVYRGDLLANVDAGWIDAERVAIRQSYEAVLDAAVDALVEAGERSLAIRYAERRVRSDPLRERSYQTLMRLYLETGDRGSCLRAFAECREILRDQVGASPDTETVRLAEEARRHDNDVREPSSARAIGALSSTYSTLIDRWPKAPTPSTRVITYLVAFAQVASERRG